VGLRTSEDDPLSKLPIRARILRRLVSLALLGTSAAGLAVVAHADSKSASFGVTATVLPACNISRTEPDVDAASMVTAVCTAGSSFSIALGTVSGMPPAIPVYGRITAGQGAAATGLHNDILVATIDF
jgi:spore coat protein U-like protein